MISLITYYNIKGELIDKEHMYIDSIIDSHVLINGPCLDDTKYHELINEGIVKQFIVIWKQYGTTDIMLYDHKLVPIVDLHSLYHAEVVYCTNQVRHNTPLVGKVVLQSSAIIQASYNSFHGRIKIVLSWIEQQGREKKIVCDLYDEQSLMKWCKKEGNIDDDNHDEHQLVLKNIHKNTIKVVIY